MTDNSHDGRYRINIQPGTRVVIEEQDKKGQLISGYVKDIMTKDAKHESGILVRLEDDVIGRVKHIGTESEYQKPIDLIITLEKRLRKLIVDVLSNNDPNWWEKIHPTVKEKAEQKHDKGKDYKKLLQIPNYQLIEETDFGDLLLIITSDKNWNNHFHKIFLNRDALKVKLDELALYRNIPAHSKDVTPHIDMKIRAYYDDLIHLIEEHYRSFQKV